jgi:ketosteroid isomerase-like protein
MRSFTPQTLIFFGASSAGTFFYTGILPFAHTPPQGQRTKASAGYPLLSGPDPAIVHAASSFTKLTEPGKHYAVSDSQRTFDQTSTMKYFLAILILCTCSIHPQTHAQSFKKAIHQIMDEQQTAWNNGDLEGFMKHYLHTDSLSFIGKTGITYGWDNTLNRYRKGYPDTTVMGKLNFTIHHIKKLSNKYCYVIGQWHLKRTGGDAGGYFTLIFEKIKHRWLIISDHSS